MPVFVALELGDLYADRVNAKSPDWYLQLSDTSGSTASATAGPNGTYQNDPQLGVSPLARDDIFGKSVGLNGASTGPSHIRSTSPIGGPDFTVDLIVQFDTLAPSKQILITPAGAANGTFSVEVLGNGRARAFSYVGGTFHEILGTIGDVTQGTVHKITYQRQSGTSPAQRMLVDGVQVAVDNNTRTWNAVPAGTVYVGAWSNGDNPFDGLISHIAAWDRYLSQGEIEDLVHIVDSAAWAENINAGVIAPQGSTIISVMDNGGHGKEPVSVTAGDGALVTTTESGDEITITAGVTGGADSFEYSLTDDNTNQSPTRTVSVTVSEGGGNGGGGGDNDHDALVMAAPGQISNTDLFAADLYYWSGDINDTIRNNWNNQD